VELYTYKGIDFNIFKQMNVKSCNLQQIQMEDTEEGRKRENNCTTLDPYCLATGSTRLVTISL